MKGYFPETNISLNIKNTSNLREITNFIKMDVFDRLVTLYIFEGNAKNIQFKLYCSSKNYNTMKICLTCL